MPRYHDIERRRPEFKWARLLTDAVKELRIRVSDLENIVRTKMEVNNKKFDGVIHEVFDHIDMVKKVEESLGIAIVHINQLHKHMNEYRLHLMECVTTEKEDNDGMAKG